MLTTCIVGIMIGIPCGVVRRTMVTNYNYVMVTDMCYVEIVPPLICLVHFLARTRVRIKIRFRIKVPVGP